MVRLITGTLGAGKTYFAVRETINLCKTGHIVFTNITFKKPPPGPGEVRPLPDSKIEDFHNHIKGGSRERPNRVIIDEGHLYWSAADQTEQKKANASLLTFLTMSRRQKVDVDLITQDDTLVNIGFRKQATWEVNLKNAADHPFLKLFPFLRDISIIRFFSPQAGKSAPPHRINVMRRGPAVWQYFDTEEIIRAKPIEVETVDAPPVKRSNRGLWYIVITLGLCWWAVGKIGKPKENPGAKPNQIAAGVASGGSPPVVNAPRYLDGYAEHKRNFAVMCGVSTFVPMRYAVLQFPNTRRYVRVGDQFFGRTIKQILPGRGNGGITLGFDQGPPSLIMPAREFQEILASINNKKEESTNEQPN